MRLLPALVLAAFLAGCASAPDAQAPAAQADPVLVRLPVEARLPLNWGIECLSICFATTQDHDMPRLPLARNETAVAVSVTLDSDEALPPGAEVEFRVECEAAVGPPCEPLGEAAGPLPLRIEVPSATVPAGATLRFSAYLVGGLAHVPVVSSHVIEAQDEMVADTEWARVTGEVQALRDPAPSPLVPAEEQREIEGDLSCNVADLNQPPYTSCSTFARPVYAIGDLGAPATRVRLELTWTADRETTRELVLTLACGQGDFTSDQGCPGLPRAEMAGPSPLVLDLAGWAPADAEFLVDVHTAPAVGLRATGIPAAESLPQPYHLRFLATVLREPDAGTGDAGRTSRG